MYLYVVKDPTKPDEIYYEFREYIIPGYTWKMDYSQTGDFNKNDTTRFGIDISILKNLPTPALDFSDNIFKVTNTTEWNAALTAIKNGGNGTAGNPKTYTITVSGNVPVSGGSTSSGSFGNVSNITVMLNGNGKLYLSSQGAVLTIGSSQTVYIDSANLTLQGLKTGQNGSSQDNNLPVVLVYGNGTLELNNGTISGNTGRAGVLVNSGSFTMNGGQSVG